MARKAAGKRTTSADGTVRVHGKASNGEGSIYRDAGGAWRATYTVPGETRPRRVRGKTREEALARRAAKLEELAQTMSGTFTATRPLPSLGRGGSTRWRAIECGRQRSASTRAASRRSRRRWA